MADSDATLATQVYRRMRSDLLEGRVQPGAKLKVQTIAVEYGVGASPVREALNSLAAEGLVERLEQRGFRAANISVAEFQELLRARCWLEEIVLNQSITAGAADWEERVVLANYRLGRLAKADTGDSQAWQGAIEYYYDALLSACPSPTLLAFCATTRERLSRYRNLVGETTAAPADQIAGYEALTVAALARDIPLASRLLVAQHLQSSDALETALA